MAPPKRSRPKPATPGASPRRLPQQERSRARVRAILRAGRELIGERGVDAVSVREIASRAEAPIASVYQYFPNKSALVWALVTEYVELYQPLLLEALGQAQTPEDLAPALHEAIDGYLELFVEHPPMLNLWHAVRADPALREYALAQAEQDAGLLGYALQRFFPRVDSRELEEAAGLAVALVGSLVPHLRAAPCETSARLMKELKRLVTLRVEALRRANDANQCRA